MRLTVNEISQILNLPDHPSNLMCLRAITDSRLARPGDLFVCIRGEKADGHDYAEMALANGACAILAERKLPALSAPVLVVKNSVRALQKLAGNWRSRFSGKLVALTGTAGKTTLKDALASILSRCGKTAKTRLNHNNQLGVALTLLETAGDENFWVIEAGISHPQDMDELGEMIRPDCALILNAAQGHTEGLGEKGVAWHKARLLRWLQADGHAIVNSDYPDLVEAAKHYDIALSFFSTRSNDNSAFKFLGEVAPGKYQLEFGGEIFNFVSSYAGKWGAEIILACAALACRLRIPVLELQKGIEQAEMPEGRMNKITAGNFEIFNDTYNANPLSMNQMLETVAQKAAMEKRPWIAVLGEMGELGSIAEASHQQLGEQLAKLKPELIIWKGQQLESLKQGLKGNPDLLSKFFPISDDAQFRILFPRLLEADFQKTRPLVLFKGSRFNHLEDWLNIFLKEAAQENIYPAR